MDDHEAVHGMSYLRSSLLYGQLCPFLVLFECPFPPLIRFARISVVSNILKDQALCFVY